MAHVALNLCTCFRGRFGTPHLGPKMPIEAEKNFRGSVTLAFGIENVRISNLPRIALSHKGGSEDFHRFQTEFFEKLSQKQHRDLFLSYWLRGYGSSYDDFRNMRRNLQSEELAGDSGAHTQQRSELFPKVHSASRRSDVDQAIRRAEIERDFGRDFLTKKVKETVLGIDQVHFLRRDESDKSDNGSSSDSDKGGEVLAASNFRRGPRRGHEAFVPQDDREISAKESGNSQKNRDSLHVELHENRKNNMIFGLAVPEEQLLQLHIITAAVQVRMFRQFICRAVCKLLVALWLVGSFTILPLMPVEEAGAKHIDYTYEATPFSDCGDHFVSCGGPIGAGVCG